MTTTGEKITLGRRKTHQPSKGKPVRELAPHNVPGAHPRSRRQKFHRFFLAVPAAVAAFLPKFKPQRQNAEKFMQNTNRLMQSSVGIFAAVLAVFLFTGYTPESSSGQTPSQATVITVPAAAPVATTNPAAASTPAAPAAEAAPAAAPVTTPAATPVPAPVVSPIRIKAGIPNSFTDAEGNVWLPDQGFTGGETYEVPDAQVTNTPNPAIYRTERYSMTSFSYPVPNGKYTVKLHFAEVYEGITGPGMRVFSFNVEGHEFKDFDIWVKAGGPNRAYVQTVDVEVTDGKLDITFTPKEENPKINGIEILPKS
jgi:hypothetical protein